jgi:hypothetical protein
MSCSATSRRADFQDELVRLNAAWVTVPERELGKAFVQIYHF